MKHNPNLNHSKLDDDAMQMNNPVSNPEDDAVTVPSKVTRKSGKVTRNET